MSDDRSPTPRRPVADFCFIRLPYLVTGTLFLVAVTINIANVIGRYVFSRPIFWAEEVLVFIIVWAIFIAAPSIVYRGEHLNMDLFISTMRPSLKRVINATMLVLFILCSAVIVWQSTKVVWLYWSGGGVSVAAGIPMVLPHAAILVGFAMMAVAAILRWRAYLTGKFD